MRAAVLKLVLLLVLGAAAVTPVLAAGAETPEEASLVPASAATCGAAGTDTLSFSGFGSAASVSLSALGTTDGFNGSATATGGFTDVNVLTGSGNTDTLTGLNADATWAVDHLSVDWNDQAAKKAAEYLAYTSFSRQGLIDQLIYEGFSPSLPTTTSASTVEDRSPATTNEVTPKVASAVRGTCIRTS